jgi:DUF1365 family protein
VIEKKGGGWRSCLFEGSVVHRRFHPKAYQFRHGLFFMSLDLDEVDALSREVAGFSRNGFDLYSFRDSDHFPFESGDFKSRVRRYAEERGVALGGDARVLLVTLPRVLGYIFNPVSFIFCFNGEGEPRCALAEVGNTFGENKVYWMGEAEEGGVFRLRAPKHFYVSPFSDLELEFEFWMRVPGEDLEIRIDDMRGDQRVLSSVLSGKRREFSAANLLLMTLKYPLVTLRVIGLIHWHALRLWAKRLPFFRKADRPDLQRGVYRPHDSLVRKSV